MLGLALALLATCRAEWKSSVRYLFSGYIEVVNITTDLDGGFLDPRHNTVLADEVLRAHKAPAAGFRVESGFTSDAIEFSGNRSSLLE